MNVSSRVRFIAWQAQAKSGFGLAPRARQGFFRPACRAGFAKLPEPEKEADGVRGQAVFQAHCALCHGANGQGQRVGDTQVFPPLWGPQSYNWGAGMHKVDTAAAFIQANLPLGQGGTLSVQDSWDVARFINGHERPQDPRFTGDVAETRAKFHNSQQSLYGTQVNGQLLGSKSH